MSDFEDHLRRTLHQAQAKELQVGEYRAVFMDEYDAEYDLGEIEVYKGDELVAFGEIQGDPSGTYFGYLRLEQPGPGGDRGFTKTLVDQWADQAYDDRSFTGIGDRDELEEVLTIALSGIK